MTQKQQQILWLCLLFGVVLMPSLLLFTADVPIRDFWTELSVALGFAGMALLGVQFIPTARIRLISNVFPVDTLYVFHRKAALAGFLMAFAHPLLLFISRPDTLALLNLLEAPWRARAAVVGTLLLLVIVGTSLWRQRFHLRYERWRSLHGISAILAAVLLLYHMFAVNTYLAHAPQRAYWVVMGLIWLAATLHIRLLRPLRLLKYPYKVMGVTAQRNNSWQLVLQPDGHEGFAYAAGQFAWLSTRNSPFGFGDNPFSIASSAEGSGVLEFHIKEEGDFSSSIKHLHAGDRVFVDGPFGNFTLSSHRATSYGLIGGGSGMVPIISILRTLADRGDSRPITLFYGSKSWEKTVYREELTVLQQQLELKVVYVLEEAPEDWSDEVGYVEAGYINAKLLDKHLPQQREGLEYFICGPPPMITAVLTALEDIGEPLQQVHTEHYVMV